MWIRLVDSDPPKLTTRVALDGGVLPEIGAIFLKDGYPFRCRAYLGEDESGEFGVLVEEAPPAMIDALLKSGVEELAKSQYDLSVVALGRGAPWPEAGALQRWYFRADAEGLLDDGPRPKGPVQ